ncbi:MAG: ATP-binding protein, partial [Bacteroidaceae bacterium]|nr:ATP-binding protein [Bacteroidaceae bacterium]
RFEATGKSISPELAQKVCDTVENHSSYVQQLAWLIWVNTDKVATEKEFEEAYKDILDQNTPLFEKQTENLSAYQLSFLRAVCDGVHKEFSTQEVIQKYRLGSSANVATVKRALIKKELIETEKREVAISDPLLKVWLQRELLRC